MIVICQNDFPIAHLGAGTPEHVADAICKKLTDEAEVKRTLEGSHGMRSYYHWHDVPEITL